MITAEEVMALKGYDLHVYEDRINHSGIVRLANESPSPR